MSFLDEPEARRPPPEPAPSARSRAAERAARRSSSGDGPGGSPPGGPRRPRREPRGDPRALFVRRVVALAAGFLVLLLAVLLVRGCLDRQQQRSFEDYTQEVSALASESEQEAARLFELLEDPAELSAVDVQNTVNGLSVDSQRLAERASSVDPPDELSRTHDQLVLTLELRRDGLEGVTGQIPTALGDDQRDEAVAAIAVEMQSFLASDVVFADRVLPRLAQVLEQEELAGQVTEVPESRFLPGVEWLEEETVREAIGRVRSAEGTEAEGDEEIAPGLHGTGLLAVTALPAGVALSPDAPTELAAAEGLSFEVEVQNQGENPEEDVLVTVAVAGAEETLEAEASIETLEEGASAVLSVPLEGIPAAGDAEITVAVEPVPGEEETENNEATYPVTFTEG